MVCPTCEGACTIKDDAKKCERCAGKGGKAKLGFCEITDPFAVGKCDVCAGKGYLFGNAPTSPTPTSPLSLFSQYYGAEQSPSKYGFYRQSSTLQVEKVMLPDLLSVIILFSLTTNNDPEAGRDGAGSPSTITDPNAAPLSAGAPRGGTIKGAPPVSASAPGNTSPLATRARKPILSPSRTPSGKVTLAPRLPIPSFSKNPPQGGAPLTKSASAESISAETANGPASPNPTAPTDPKNATKTPIRLPLKAASTVDVKPTTPTTNTPNSGPISPRGNTTSPSASGPISPRGGNTGPAPARNAAGAPPKILSTPISPRGSNPSATASPNATRSLPATPTPTTEKPTEAEEVTDKQNSKQAKPVSKHGRKPSNTQVTTTGGATIRIRPVSGRGWRKGVKKEVTVFYPAPVRSSLKRLIHCLRSLGSVKQSKDDEDMLEASEHTIAVKWVHEMINGRTMLSGQGYGINIGYGNE